MGNTMGINNYDSGNIATLNQYESFDDFLASFPSATNEQINQFDERISQWANISNFIWIDEEVNNNQRMTNTLGMILVNAQGKPTSFVSLSDKPILLEYKTICAGVFGNFKADTAYIMFDIRDACETAQILYEKYKDTGDKWCILLALNNHKLPQIIKEFSRYKHLIVPTDPYTPKEKLLQMLQGVGNCEVWVTDFDLPTMLYHGNIPSEIIHLSANKNNDKWDTIIPFSDTQNHETPFPVEAFSPLLQSVIKKIAYYKQVPLSMAGLCLLGALSHIGQEFIKIPFGDGFKPASLYLLIQGESGTGKTETMSLTHKAIFDNQRENYLTYSEDLDSFRNGQIGLKGRELKDFLLHFPEPQDPRTLFRSGTFEDIFTGFTYGNYKNVSYTADEASRIFDGYNLKSDTAGDTIGALCSVWSDGIIERNIKSHKGKKCAYDVALTMLLAGQPIVIHNALNDERMTNQGLLPRFLFAFPADMRGYRDYTLKDNPHHDQDLRKYWDKCTKHLENSSQERKPLILQGQAFTRLNTYRQTVENTQAKGGINEHYKAFASRLAENVARLAGIFAWFDDRDKITSDDIESAIKIVDYSMSERRRYSEITTEISNAQKALLWIVKQCKKNGQDFLFYANIQSSITPKSLRTRAIFENTISELHAMNYIKHVENDGKKIVLVNPQVLE